MGLKRHHAAGHATVAGFVVQQGQHGLVAAVHTVKVADGQGAGRGQRGVVKTSENLHGAQWLVRDKDMTRNRCILSLIDVCIPNRCFQLE